jgi:hypothetical protein
MKLFSKEHLDVEAYASLAPPQLPELPTVDGQLLQVSPIRLAVVKLWVCSICKGPGCRTSVDSATGELPDLFKVEDISTSENNLRKDRNDVARRCYYGQWLINTADLHIQLVPTSVISGGTQDSMFFMTANKASGRF